jgi:hypothetical protein
MRADGRRDKRYPWWQLILIGLGGRVEVATWPFRRLWRSDDALDSYALVQLGSAGGDALLAIALADSIFFSIPVDEAQWRVALYLMLTMAPLAVAGPALVPLLDRAGPRRAISVTSAVGRAFLALLVAPRMGSVVLFPLVFMILVLSRVHGITKNGIVMAFAGSEEGLVRANARMGRVAIAGAAVAALPGLLLLWLGGPSAVLYLASAVYAITGLLNLRMPTPRIPPSAPGELASVGRRGRLKELTTPAIGAIGLRAAAGFLLFLLAFALRRGGEPTSWFGVLVVAGLAGALLADMLAPRLSNTVREEIVVIGCVIGAGLGAVLAFRAFTLPVLAVFALVAGAGAEFGRLAFQSLVQRGAPARALGRVLVRYEVMFQLAWVAGAVLPALLPIEFRGGILILGAFYTVVAISYLAWPGIERRLAERSNDIS